MTSLVTPASHEDRIIDAHCHVASTKFIPREFLQGVAGAMHRRLISYGQKITKDQIFEMLVKQNQDHLADELVAEMDAAQISQTILLVPDFSQAMTCEMPIQEMAQHHDQIRCRHPGRFRIFMGTDPRKGRSAVTDFEICIDRYAIDGLKLYPPCGYSPSDPALFPYYEICAHAGLPVLLHTGPTAQSLDFTYSHPSQIETASRTFPNVNFILAHGGVNYVKPTVDLCRYRENVYMDIGGFTGAIHHQGWQAHLRELFSYGVNHKIIFGTDWPVFRMSGGLAKVVRLLRDNVINKLNSRERQLILAGTITRLLGKRDECATSHATHILHPEHLGERLV